MSQRQAPETRELNVEVEEVDGEEFSDYPNEYTDGWGQYFDSEDDENP